MKKIQELHYNYIFFGMLIFGNIFFGFLARYANSVILHYSISNEVRYFITFFLVGYLLFSSFLAFRQSKSVSEIYRKIIFIFLVILVLSSIFTFILIGMVSPLSFIGWYLFQGLVRGTWDLSFLTQMMEVYYG